MHSPFDEVWSDPPGTAGTAGTAKGLCRMRLMDLLVLGEGTLDAAAPGKKSSLFLTSLGLLVETLRV